MSVGVSASIETEDLPECLWKGGILFRVFVDECG